MTVAFGIYFTQKDSASDPLKIIMQFIVFIIYNKLNAKLTCFLHCSS